MPYPHPSTAAAINAAAMVSTDAAHAATAMPTTNRDSATKAPRALAGVSIRRPTAWIANPEPRAITAIAADRATG